MSQSSADDSHRNGASTDPSLVERVAELADRIASGEPVDLDALARNDPARVRELRRMLPAIAMMADLGAASIDRPASPGAPGAGGSIHPLGRLGDFVLVREIGRGGMGVVYEARQLSIDRRVALKILPPAAAADPRQLRRFQLEAQAVAYLRNPHIVPVYSVGVERGVHFFAMLYVEGRTLAEVLRSLRYRDDAGAGLPATELSAAPTVDLAPTSPLGALPIGPADEPTTAPETLGTEHVRWVARLGVQAAEALQHAHEQGVVHRDIKPGNLMLDDGDRLWITDFGLARLQGDAGVTMSGDLLGTLRYMSPEQAAGGKVVVDGRTDIYSLGITLYELLTLRAAFDDGDRQTVLRRIVEEEPEPPRRLNPRIPADLETIIAKATAKEPAERYATAGELAEDLRRFLEHRPILARRPSPLDLASKWVRRHRALTAAGAVILMLATVALAVGIVLIGREQGRTAAALRVSEANLRLAEAAAARARGSERFVQQLLYTSDMRLANRAWRRGDPRLTRELLDRHLPEPGREDLRDFAWYLLDARIDVPGEEVAAGHGPAYCVEPSPDGRLLAVAGQDGRIRLYDTGDGDRLVGSFDSEQSEVNDLAFAPDGRTLASAGDDGTVRTWSVADGRLIRSIPAHGDWVVGVSFVDGDRRLASCSRDGALRLWDLETGQDVWTFTLDGPIAAMADDPETPYIAITELKGEHVVIVDRATGQRVRDFRVGERATDVAVSPDGRLLAVGGRYGALMVVTWQNDAAEPFRMRITDGVETLAFGPDGAHLFAGDRGGVIRCWTVDPATGQLGDPIGLLPPEAAGSDPIGQSWAAHEGRAYDLGIPTAAGPILSAGEDGRVVRWDLWHRDWRHEYPAPGDAPAFRGLAAGPGGLLAVARGGGGVALWDPRSASEPHPLGPPPAAGESWLRVVTSRDGGLVAALALDRVVVRDARTGAERFGWTAPQPSYLHRLALSPDGRTLAVIGGLTAWSEPGRRLPADSLQGDSTTFAVSLFDVASGKRIGTIPAPMADEVALAPDGRTVAIGINDVIQLHDVASGELLHTLPDHSSTVTGLAFTPDGRRLISTGDGRRLIFWDPATGEPTSSILAHRGPIESMDVSPDGRLVATLGLDDGVKLWHIATGQQLLDFPVDGQWSETRVCFVADGRALAVNLPESLVLFDAR